MNRRQFLWLFISLILVISLVMWLRFLYFPVVTDPKGIHYILHPHESIKTFTKDLAKQNLIDHPRMLRIFLHLRGQARKLKAGEYYFPKGTTLFGIIDQMVEGRGVIYRSFTIIPGWTFQQVRQALLADNKLRHTIDNLSGEEIMQHLGSFDEQVEGQFFPDTYYFLEGSPDLVLLQRAYLMMQKKLNKAWETRSDHLPFKNSYEGLIAASLIEKEAYLNQEQPIIAGVLVNRLRKSMLLQFDPTVIYGMKSRYNGSIHKQDLRRDTPFNTYIHKGLPPTPIAMSSMGSIMAALHPAQHDYLYFVAHGDGSHQFSRTLVEHNKAVAEAGKISAPFFNLLLIKNYLVRNYHG